MPSCDSLSTVTNTCNLRLNSHALAIPLFASRRHPRVQRIQVRFWRHPLRAVHLPFGHRTERACGPCTPRGHRAASHGSPHAHLRVRRSSPSLPPHHRTPSWRVATPRRRFLGAIFRCSEDATGRGSRRACPSFARPGCADTSAPPSPSVSSRLTPSPVLPVPVPPRLRRRLRLRSCAACDGFLLAG